MEWIDAINQSEEGIAVRVQEKNGIKHTTVRYLQDAGYLIVGNIRADFSNIRYATSEELNGYTDWMPSKMAYYTTPNP